VGVTFSFEMDRPLVMHPLAILDEGGEVTVGRLDINSYVILPHDGAALLRQLQAGMPPQRCGDWYAERYGEDVDIEEFLTTLDEFGLLVRDGEQPAAQRKVRYQRFGRALFSPATWVFYVVLVVAAGAAMIAQPELAPRYQNLFFTHYLAVLNLCLLAGQLPLILVHEGFHGLAGRRLGVHSTLRIGRRFYFLVFETRLDGLVLVPRRKRYLPILAGIVADVLVVAVLTLAAYFLRTPSGESMAGRVCLALAFATLLRVSWQFYFFLRTDLYHLVVTVLGCTDLHATAKALLRRRLLRLLGRTAQPADAQEWHPRDYAVARWYSWLMAAGYGVLAMMMVFAVIPSIARMISIVLAHLRGEASATGFLDATLFLCLNVTQLGLVALLAWRDRRQRASAVR
jgi:hypothetical protein